MALSPEPELTARFFEKVDVGDADECWNWTAGTISQGYGSIGTNSGGKELAHRYMMKLHGFSLDDKQVNHTCDNRVCVNPTHLYTGTQADNMDDAVKRDRFPTGKDHHATKLNKEDVKDIRSKHQSGTSMNELGREYDVDPKTISDVVNRRSWDWVK